MPFVLKKRVYAVAAIVGALGYALLLRMGVNGVMAYALGMMADNRRAHSGDGVQMESAEGDLSRSLYIKNRTAEAARFF